MTQTIGSNTFAFTDDFFAERSSVISSVFYNADEKRMVVSLENGVLCGYQDVPREVFENFKLQETTRKSVGYFWNTFVKDRFPGFSTDWIEEVDPVEEDVVNRKSFADFSRVLDNLEDDEANPFNVFVNKLIDAAEEFVLDVANDTSIVTNFLNSLRR